jgi:hypothetical protein
MNDIKDYKKNWEVYMLTCTVNGKRFFGKTKSNIFGNLAFFSKVVDLANDIRFYEWDNFTYTVMGEEEDGFQADSIINTLIEHFCAYSSLFGYNYYKKNRIINFDYKRKISALVAPYQDVTEESLLNIDRGIVPIKKRIEKDSPAEGICTPVKQFTSEWVLIARYDSIKEASEKLGLKHGNISRACKKPQYTAGGFHFRYC